MTRMERVYTYVYQYWRQHRMSPTLHEIVMGINITRAQLEIALHRLESAGVIKYIPDAYRPVAIVQQEPGSDKMGTWKPPTISSSNGRMKSTTSTTASRRNTASRRR